jgi:hypothetical protein
MRPEFCRVGTPAHLNVLNRSARGVLFNLLSWLLRSVVYDKEVP